MITKMLKCFKCEKDFEENQTKQIGFDIIDDPYYVYTTFTEIFCLECFKKINDIIQPERSKREECCKHFRDLTISMRCALSMYHTDYCENGDDAGIDWCDQCSLCLKSFSKGLLHMRCSEHGG